MLIGLAISICKRLTSGISPSGGAGDDLLIEGVALDSLLMEDGVSIILLETN